MYHCIIAISWQVSIVHPKSSSKSNPQARWLVGRGPINHVSFSTDGKARV